MPGRPAFKPQFLAANAEPNTLALVFSSFVQAVAAAVAPLLANPRANSSVQTVALVAATPKVVPHKLTLAPAVTPNGWAITDIDQNASVYRVAWDATTITIQSGSTCNVQLEVW